MTFTLIITTDNAAFHDEDCEGEHQTNSTGSPIAPCSCLGLRLELSTILKKISKTIAQNGLSGFFETIRDANGNDIGRYAIKPDSYR